VIPVTRAISERIGGGYDDALYKSMFTSTMDADKYQSSLSGGSEERVRLLPKMVSSHYLQQTDAQLPSSHCL